MTRPNPPIRVRDLPPDHATLLDRIHQLATDGARLRRAVRTAAPVADSSASLIAQLNDIDRDRSLTEIQARHIGIPAEWVDQARDAGQAGDGWCGDHVLASPRVPARRRSSQRVAADTRQLADMASISVVREHRLHAAGGLAEPDPAAAMQLRRNMHALWTRARLTAEATAMNDHDRAGIFGEAITEVDRRVVGYSHDLLDDLDTRWRSHTAPAIADGVRRSLKSLRRSSASTAEQGGREPPTPKTLLERARCALQAAENTVDSGDEIATAVTAAISETTTRSWNDDLEAPAADSDTIAASRDSGPDP